MNDYAFALYQIGDRRSIADISHDEPHAQIPEGGRQITEDNFSSPIRGKTQLYPA
jgi:hypothetical protein